MLRACRSLRLKDWGKMTASITSAAVFPASVHTHKHHSGISNEDGGGTSPFQAMPGSCNQGENSYTHFYWRLAGGKATDWMPGRKGLATSKAVQRRWLHCNLLRGRWSGIPTGRRQSFHLPSVSLPLMLDCKWEGRAGKWSQSKSTTTSGKWPWFRGRASALNAEGCWF